MRTIIQALAIVVASLILAVTANALASRTRKVMLVGWYPNATAVSARSEQPAASSAQPPPVRVNAPVPAPAPVTTTIPPVTATIAKPTPQPKLPTANRQLPTPPPAPAPAQPDVLAKFPQHPDKPYIEIAFDDVKALHDKGVLFLDARRTSVYEQGHIPGARPYSVWESDIDEKVRKLFDERSDAEAQAKPIVVYCSGGDCEDSHMLAQKLWGIQFNNVYVYKDGFPDWQKRGGAVMTGGNP